MPSTAEELVTPRGHVLCRGMSRHSQVPETLQDLLLAIEFQKPEYRHLLPMLRATARHMAMYLKMPASKISIGQLADVKPGLQVYLRAQGNKRNSVRSYTSYLGMLLRKAKELGWVEYRPGVARAWRDISALVADVHGGPGIVRYAIRQGRVPATFGESDLADWAKTMLRLKRTPDYVRAVKSRFRKRVFDAGFGSHFPHLRRLGNNNVYGIRVSEFPETLRMQVRDLLRWKTAHFSPGRPSKGKHRPVTAHNLEGLFSRLCGFLVRIKGRTVNSLEGLLSQQSVSEYAEWAVNERGIGGRALTVQLGNIRALRAYPGLASLDFGYIPKLVSQLPEGSEVQAKEKKERKWIEYDVLAKIPDQILQDANGIVDLGEKSKALMVRDALLIRWLATLPSRQRNIRECKVMAFADGGNVSKEPIPTHSTIAKARWVCEALRANPDETFWQFYFRPEETKTGQAVRGILPRHLITPSEDYLTAGSAATICRARSCRR